MADYLDAARNYAEDLAQRPILGAIWRMTHMREHYLLTSVGPNLADILQRGPGARFETVSTQDRDQMEELQDMIGL